MPHRRFKRTRRASRSHIPSAYKARAGHLFATCSSRSDSTTSSDATDYVAAPYERPAVRNPRLMKTRRRVLGHSEASQKGGLHRDVSGGDFMVSRGPDVSYSSILQDFNYGLNWRRTLVKRGLGNELEDWNAFVRDACAKLAEREEKEMEARWRKAKDALAAHRAQLAGDGTDPDDGMLTTANVDPVLPAGEGSEGQTAQPPGDVASSHDAEADPSGAEHYAVEDLAGVQAPVVGPQNDDVPSEEWMKNQCQQCTVRWPSARCVSDATNITF